MKAKSEFLSEEIVSQLREKGISQELALSQIETFKKGIPFTELIRPCRIGDGVENIDEELDKYVSIYEAQSLPKKVIKFVPASGAASRMFKELLAVNGRGSEITKDELNQVSDSDSLAFLHFINCLPQFAFVDELKKSMAKDGIDLDFELAQGRYKSIADYTLGPVGLNYSNLPKGIIEFHSYGNGSRTAFEEHLLEAEEYSKDGENISRLHFTVSQEHLERVKDLLKSRIGNYESDGSTFEINYSIQKPSTDTLAVDMNNDPLLDNTGNVVLRPGGHGALIENLNELDCDIAFIKNIDNVVPDRLKFDTILYKKALGGYLLSLQNRIFGYINDLEARISSHEVLLSMTEFVQEELNIELPSQFDNLSLDEKVKILRAKLDRPIRICGVVKNVGEPGGGPFWIRVADGGVSKQIVESAQVDLNSEEQETIWQSSTHFNPVDLVCGLKNYKGQNFDLKKYVNPDMGFISHKSKDGVDLKALELPGLWNGAMADWNTLFIEIPLITFNPVKSVLDLLRPEHQPDEINQ